MSGKFFSSMSEDLSAKQIPILVVDDSRDNLDLMEALLLSEGFESIRSAASGPEALACLADHPDIGLVLLDIMMPGMDGIEVCRRIAQSDFWHHIPVIMVTGGALRRGEALKKGFAAGAMDFISKPVDEVELLMRVNSALTLYQERVIRMNKTRELLESEERFRVTFDQAPIGIAHVDLAGKIMLVNERFGSMLGYAGEDLRGLEFSGLFERPQEEALNAPGKRLFEDGDACRTAELALVHKQDRIVRVQLRVSPLRCPSGKIRYFICVFEDITERKRAEENLRLAASVFDNSIEAIVITDAHANIVKTNRAFTEITGYGPNEVIGKNPRLLSSGLHNAEFYRSMGAILIDTGQWAGEIINRRKNGEIYPSWLTLSIVKDERGEITNYVGISADITVRKEHEERLSFLANHDALTRLPNRILFNDRLKQAVARANREVTEMAILFVDLDDFKNVNDSFGHITGDSALQIVSKRLLDCVRKSDTLARWGGDEFILLLEKIVSAEDVAGVAQKVLKRISGPFQIDNHEIALTASIGISRFPKDAKDLTALLKGADGAMYRAKESGGNNYQFSSIIKSG
ncbi:MAG TPA: diguanylate cyclase [Syntrophobacteraceae bacterium]|nr:diguanylate cyclase [Syntrophobacteraceae bacterium]